MCVLGACMEYARCKCVTCTVYVCMYVHRYFQNTKKKYLRYLSVSLSYTAPDSETECADSVM